MRKYSNVADTLLNFQELDSYTLLIDIIFNNNLTYNEVIIKKQMMIEAC